MTRFVRFALPLAAFICCSPLLADDVTDADQLLCAPMVVHECRADGDCVGGAPWEFDIGPFVRVDLKNKRVESTRTDIDRSSSITNQVRDAAHIVVQGYELGRAYSFLISQESGFFSGSITLDDGVITIFGACKPDTSK